MNFKTIIKDKIVEKYMGCDIVATHYIFDHEIEPNRFLKRKIQWEIFKDGRLILQDTKDLNCNDLQSCKHAINDAKEVCKHLGVLKEK